MIYTNGTLPKNLNPWDVVILFPPLGRPPVSVICHPVPEPVLRLRMPARWLPSPPPWRLDEPLKTLRELAEDFGSQPWHEQAIQQALQAEKPVWQGGIARVAPGIPVAEKVAGKVWRYDAAPPQKEVTHRELVATGTLEVELNAVTQHWIGACSRPGPLGWGSPSLFLRLGRNRCAACERAATRFLSSP